MPHYIYGTVITDAAASANSRGQILGNLTPLQKMVFKNQVFTTVSAEAIRFALRYRFQLEGLKVNRSFDAEENRFVYFDETRQCWKNGIRFIDDDIMGFMDARAAAVETLDETNKPNKRSKKNPAPEAAAKGTVSKRPSPLSVGRAISLRPYNGEHSFNSVAAEKLNKRPTLYRSEMHTTEFQYTFGLNADTVADKSNILHLLDAIADPPPVAGNAARFYFDFSPASIILRLTNRHSSGIQNCFQLCGKQEDSITIPKVLARLKSGDLKPDELIIGGAICETAEIGEFQKLGVETHAGINNSIDSLKRKISSLFSLPVQTK